MRLGLLWYACCGIGYRLSSVPDPDDERTETRRELGKLGGSIAGGSIELLHSLGGDAVGDFSLVAHTRRDGAGLEPHDSRSTDQPPF